MLFYDFVHLPNCFFLTETSVNRQIAVLCDGTANRTDRGGEESFGGTVSNLYLI